MKHLARTLPPSAVGAGVCFVLGALCLQAACPRLDMALKIVSELQDLHVAQAVLGATLAVLLGAHGALATTTGVQAAARGAVQGALVVLNTEAAPAERQMKENLECGSRPASSERKPTGADDGLRLRLFAEKGARAAEYFIGTPLKGNSVEQHVVAFQNSLDETSAAAPSEHVTSAMEVEGPRLEHHGCEDGLCILCAGVASAVDKHSSGQLARSDDSHCGEASAEEIGSSSNETSAIDAVAAPELPKVDARRAADADEESGSGRFARSCYSQGGEIVRRVARETRLVRFGLSEPATSRIEATTAALSPVTASSNDEASDVDAMEADGQLEATEADLKSDALFAAAGIDCVPVPAELRTRRFGVCQDHDRRRSWEDLVMHARLPEAGRITCQLGSWCQLPEEHARKKKQSLRSKTRIRGT